MRAMIALGVLLMVTFLTVASGGGKGGGLVVICALGLAVVIATIPGSR